MSEPMDLNARLKQAVRSVEPPPFLEARIRNQIRSEREGRKGVKLFRWMPIATAVAICVTGGIAYQLGYLRMTVASQESYIAKVSSQVGALMRVGLSDHLHCAVFRKYPKNPPPVEQFVQDLGPRYAGLLPVVQKSVAGSFRLTMAHQCRYQKRQFVHFTMAGEGRLVSMIIARKADGETFAVEGVLPSLVRSGTSIYGTGVQRFAIDAFETRDHLVYLVSDFPREKNAEMLTAMARPVTEFLKSVEL